jgi:hypothetical protein
MGRSYVKHHVYIGPDCEYPVIYYMKAEDKSENIFTSFLLTGFVCFWGADQNIQEKLYEKEMKMLNTAE